MRSTYSLSVLLAALSTAAAFPTDGRHASFLAVNTSSGVFEPYFAQQQPEVAAFLDIPYAEPPVGDLRFAPPVAKSHSGNKVVKATNLPGGCFQYMASNFRGTITSGPVTAAEFQRGDFSNTTEDCLRLSVFAPKGRTVNSLSHARASREALPVIVWIHGGGFSFGGTNTPYSLAPNWVQRSQKHIVVQIQYRLNILGLPNAAALAADGNNYNLALLDQRLAVEWVHKNIARFGGDPDRITLWGESAGAYAVDSYLFAWPQEPLVAGVIADSGNAVAMESIISDSSEHSTFSLVASRLGCGNLSATEELACMRKVPAEKIKTYFQAEIGDGGAADDALVFGVVADNVTIFSNYTERIGTDGSKFPAHIPLLIGTNTDEGTAIVPYNFENSETATELPSELEKVAQGFALNLQCTTLREVRLRAEVGATTYQYLYAGNFTNISPLPWLGAYHTAELPLVFGTYGINGESTEFEHRVSRKMQDRYLEFATDSLRESKHTGWPTTMAESEKSKIVKWAADNKVEQVVGAKGLRDECVENGFMV